ncbi:MFS transporter [Sphingobacterium tabacisoli]|uniref:MFS transporter n=1 Tax=Sphingobacterium tabacisoli TaxID=2044855 RepID=A0ABW5KX58_9SPHI|nr:MFS transporter [Sphingobacterium tabacisoli]
MNVNTAKVGNYRWVICSLLFFATTINYMDRQVLSLLKPTLEEEFNWSNSDYADIAAIFQFVYAVSMLFAGRFVDRIGTKWGYAWSIILWSVGAIIHAYAISIGDGINQVFEWIGIAALPVSIIGFMFARGVLAIGEAGNFPSAIKATAEYFPKSERSFATGIFNSGANIGAILAPLSVPWIANHWGWATAFEIVGALGFIWLIFWFIFYETPAKQKRMGDEERAYISKDQEEDKRRRKAGLSEEDEKPVSWLKLLKFRQTWAFTLGKFMTDGVWWFFLFWLPGYLKDQYNIVNEDIMLPLAVLYSMTMIGSVAGGWFPKYFIARGYAAYDGRMKAMLTIAFFPLLVLLAQPLGGVSFWLPVLLIGIGTSAHQAWSANIFTTVSDMFPRRAVASVVGIGGMAGGVGGALITKLGGYLFDHYKSLGHIETGYTIMFSICAIAYLAAWSVMKLLVPKMKVISFD